MICEFTSLPRSDGYVIAMPFYYSVDEEWSVSSLPNVLVGFHPQPASVITARHTATVRNVMSCNRSHHLQHPSQGRVHVHADARVQRGDVLCQVSARESGVFLVSFPKGIF